jgi:hypothetical protein
VARELRRKLHDMGYNGYYEYFLHEHIRPERKRKQASLTRGSPAPTDGNIAVGVIVIVACIVLCFALSVMILVPLRWFVQ